MIALARESAAPIRDHLEYRRAVPLIKRWREWMREPDMAEAERTLGVLGGMGPLATAHFYRRLVERTSASADQDHHRVVMVSEPRVPDRTSFLLGEGEDPGPVLVQAAHRLARSGCDLIVIPCNTASVFRNEVEDAVHIPVLDWIGSTGSSIQATVEGPVGLLATSGTIAAGLYQAELAGREIEFRVPLPEAQRDAMAAIYAVKAASRATQPAIVALRSAVDMLVADGASSVLLGCTELPILVASSMWTATVPVVDPGEIAISEILDWFQTGRLA